MTPFRDLERKEQLKKILVPVLTALVLLAIAGGGYKFYRHQQWQCQVVLQQVSDDQNTAADLVRRFDTLEQSAKELQLTPPDSRLGSDLRSVQNYEVGECGLLEKGNVEANAKVVHDTLQELAPKVQAAEDALAPQIREKATALVNALPDNEYTRPLKEQLPNAQSLDELVQLAFSAHQLQQAPAN